MFSVGASNGNLAIYELRQSKCQMIQAHSSAIIAAAFSPDGKYLVSYSCGENRLSFWQTSTGEQYFINIDYQCNAIYAIFSISFIFNTTILSCSINKKIIK